jgi:hypothetical protein
MRRTCTGGAWALSARRRASVSRIRWQLVAWIAAAWASDHARTVAAMPPPEDHSECFHYDLLPYSLEDGALASLFCRKALPPHIIVHFNDQLSVC